jgi:hypothetical protein
MRGAIGLLLMAVALPVSAQWTEIMLPGEEVEYARYAPSGVVEDFSTVPAWKGSGNNLFNSPRPPITYNFSDIGGGAAISVPRSICPAGNHNLDNSAWPNWTGKFPSQPAAFYNPAEFQLPGGYTFAPPSEYNESQILSGVLGFEFQGSFNGSVTGPGSVAAVDVVYITDNPCAAGDNEYGFYYDVAQSGPLVFYYADKTNCGNAPPYCYTDSGFAKGIESQSTSPNTNITGLAPGVTYIAHAYMIPDTPGPHSENFRFRVEVMNPNRTFATCSFNGGAPGACTIDIPIDPSYVWDHFADQMYAESDVNIVTGIATGGNPTNITPSAGLTIDNVSVRRIADVPVRRWWQFR